MKRGDKYQIALIGLGLVATFLFLVFFYRELFPEYMIYQKDYIALENFRSSYTGEPPPAFQTGIKQIVIEKEDKGNPTIDRCVSCHVALQIPYFSPTKIEKDINGKMVLDEKGLPSQVPNDDYIWGKLDAEINKLRSEGKNSDADGYEKLKSTTVDGITYDVTKVLRMHPLMGKETRPFEYHSPDQFGCVACHGGNGRGLVTDRAHGPVFDGTYDVEYEGYVPEFLEKDPQNDPIFSEAYNDKPGPRLIFQTNPLYVGHLIEAKCVQCHMSSDEALKNAAYSATQVTGIRTREILALEKSLEEDERSLTSLIELESLVKKEGVDKAIQTLTKKASSPFLSKPDSDEVNVQITFLKKNPKNALELIHEQITLAIGPLAYEGLTEGNINKFIEDNIKTAKEGSLFKKATQLNFEKEIAKHIGDINDSLNSGVKDARAIGKIETDVDRLTHDYQRGQELFIAQACYACHRIETFSKGGVGPELSKEGTGYPWFIKQSIVWPQADLKTSTMPNQRLDHEELEDLVTFLLAQTGARKTISPTAKTALVHDWEAGNYRQSWEEAIPASKIHDLDFSMTVFATQGCASCHRLQGFESDVGFTVEKTNKDFSALLKERDWFQSVFPEDISGSEIVKAIEANKLEIDKRISPHIRENSLVERIEKSYPGLIETYYSPFKFALRANNHKLTGHDLEKYKTQVHNVLMTYIQVYGLGRIIGPRPNWSGITRSDEWLMEHFKKPTSHIPRSIMPIMPFDETKFYALTYMLDILGKKNRDFLRRLWDQKGFRPEEAYKIHCAQCHGDYLQGNGPVAEWIYPLPKNLKNTDFMRNLTKARVKVSIMHGIKGTPMPPWGETPSDKPFKNTIPILSEHEIDILADWLYSTLPGGSVINPQKIPKWNYSPEDVLKDLKREGGEFKKNPELGSYFPKAKNLIAANGFSQTREPDITVAELFDVKPNPFDGPDEHFYYIKKEYYTPENIEAGKNIFLYNCAICHGKEADGASIRAEAMHDAKPRMLINLDWLNYRDDLRLLRSIKYGVPGTAMTPWGDLTTSLQRLQLVLYIRSLSEKNNTQEMLSNALYDSFDKGDIVIETARSQTSRQLIALEKEYETATKVPYSDIKDEKTALDQFRKQIELKKKLESIQKQDAIISQIRELLKEEKQSYLEPGQLILQLDDPDPLLTPYLKLIDIEAGVIAVKDGKLTYEEKKGAELEKNVYTKDILSQISSIEMELDKQSKEVEGRISSNDKDDEIKSLKTKLDSLKKLERSFLSSMEKVKEEQQTIKKLIAEYKQSNGKE